jgi:hypothetical protein
MFPQWVLPLRRPGNHQLRTAMVTADWRGCEGGLQPVGFELSNLLQIPLRVPAHARKRQNFDGTLLPLHRYVTCDPRSFRVIRSAIAVVGTTRTRAIETTAVR